jgi:tetratricopeptide (TPR) repeat protein
MILKIIQCKRNFSSSLCLLIFCNFFGNFYCNGSRQTPLNNKPGTPPPPPSEAMPRPGGVGGAPIPNDSVTLAQFQSLLADMAQTAGTATEKNINSINLVNQTLALYNQLYPHATQTEKDQLESLCRRYLEYKSQETLEQTRSAAAQTKYYENANSWKITIFTICLKAICTAIATAACAEIFDKLKTIWSVQNQLITLEEDSLVIINNFSKKKTLYFTEEQQELYDSLLHQLKDIVKNGGRKNTSKPQNTLFLLGGIPGTGKSSFIGRIMYELLCLEKKKKLSLFEKFTRNFLPKWLKVLFKIKKHKNCYNYSNEQEKAAALLEEILRSLLKHIENNPDNYFVFNVEEGEWLLKDPFARVWKVIISILSLMITKKRNGYGIILISTNYPDQSLDTLSRRLTLLNFGNPSSDAKLKAFLLYMEENFNKGDYTSAIIEYINKWLKFCELFSHSDMENITWLLKLKSITSKDLVTGVPKIITLLDLWQIIAMELKKRGEIILKLNKEQLKTISPQLQKLIIDYTDLKKTYINDIMFSSPVAAAA